MWGKSPLSPVSPLITRLLKEDYIQIIATFKKYYDFVNDKIILPLNFKFNSLTFFCLQLWI